MRTSPAASIAGPMSLTTRRPIGEPVGLAPADHVGADDAELALHRPGENVEVAALARDAVDADQHPVVRRIAPLPVRHPVQAARAQALHLAEPRLVRCVLRVRHFICTVPLTVALTWALPGSTESASPGADIAEAWARIIGCGPPGGSLVVTLTSRMA